MENFQNPPQSQLPPPVSRSTNPVTIIVIVILLIALAVGIVLVINNYASSQKNGLVMEEGVSDGISSESVPSQTNETKPTEDQQATVTTETPLLNNSQTNIVSTDVGRGEAIFVATSQTETVVREIHLHNPEKDSWILVYEGSKTITLAPIEVYRTTLAAITYDKIRVRTLNNSVDFDKTVTVKKNDSIAVNLDL